MIKIDSEADFEKEMEQLLFETPKYVGGYRLGKDHYVQSFEHCLMVSSLFGVKGFPTYIQNTISS